MTHTIRYGCIDSAQFQKMDDAEFNKVLQLTNFTAETYDEAKKVAEEFAAAFPDKAPFYIIQVMKSTSVVGKVEAKDV